jgi:hypothetical protein
VGASVRLFDLFGTPRIMQFLTRAGVSPNDAYAHYCLDLECDIDGLRGLDDTALAEGLAHEPRPIRRALLLSVCNNICCKRADNRI